MKKIFVSVYVCLLVLMFPAVSAAEQTVITKAADIGCVTRYFARTGGAKWRALDGSPLRIRKGESLRVTHACVGVTEATLDGQKCTIKEPKADAAVLDPAGYKLAVCDLVPSKEGDLVLDAKGAAGKKFSVVFEADPDTTATKVEAVEKEVVSQGQDLDDVKRDVVEVREEVANLSRNWLLTGSYYFSLSPGSNPASGLRLNFQGAIWHPTETLSLDLGAQLGWESWAQDVRNVPGLSNFNSKVDASSYKFAGTFSARWTPAEWIALMGRGHLGAVVNNFGSRILSQDPVSRTITLSPPGSETAPNFGIEASALFLIKGSFGAGIGMGYDQALRVSTVRAASLNGSGVIPQANGEANVGRILVALYLGGQF